MDNNSSERSLRTGRDKKLHRTALFVWWRVSFVLSFLVMFIFVDTGNSFLRRLPKLLLLSLAASVVLTLLLIYGVLPLMNRFQKPYSALLRKLLAEGMTPETESELKDMYNKCRANSTAADYTQSIGIILANHYTEAGDYEKAHEYMDAIDNSMSFEYSNIPTYQARILEYFALKTALGAAEGGRSGAEAAYSQAKHFFEKYSGTNQVNAYWTALGTAEYLIACGEPEKAVKEIEPFMDYKEAKTDVLLMLAKAAEAMGDNDKARKYINLAWDSTTSVYNRNIVEQRKARLKS